MRCLEGRVCGPAARRSAKTAEVPARERKGGRAGEEAGRRATAEHPAAPAAERGSARVEEAPGRKGRAGSEERAIPAARQLARATDRQRAGRDLGAAGQDDG